MKSTLSLYQVILYTVLTPRVHVLLRELLRNSFVPNYIQPEASIHFNKLFFSTQKIVVTLQWGSGLGWYLISSSFLTLTVGIWLYDHISKFLFFLL